MQGLRDVLCDAQTCKNIQPGTRKHREVFGGAAKRTTAKEEYGVPAKLVEYLVTGDQLMTELYGPKDPLDCIRVHDGFDSNVGGSAMASHDQCYLRVRAEF